MRTIDLRTVRDTSVVACITIFRPVLHALGGSAGRGPRDCGHRCCRDPGQDGLWRGQRSSIVERGRKAGQGRLQGGKPGRGGERPPAPIAVVEPALPDLVRPQIIGSDDHQLPVRSPAMLAAPAGTIKVDHLA